MPAEVLAELQGGEWGRFQGMPGIANWSACASSLTHFPFERGMTRSVELSPRDLLILQSSQVN